VMLMFNIGIVRGFKAIRELTFGIQRVRRKIRMIERYADAAFSLRSNAARETCGWLLCMCSM